MHVITHRRILEFAKRHPRAAEPLDAWYRLVKAAAFKDHASLKALFATADRVGKRYVFDIGGNHYRLIASVHFDKRRVFTREILTHAEYDHWKPI